MSAQTVKSKFLSLDGINTVDVTLAQDSETQPGATETGFGEATGTAVGDVLTFFVGSGSNINTGGTVTSADTFTIIYQVMID